MKEIELTQGYKTIVDDSSFEILSKYKWRALKTKYGVYAKTNITKTKVVLMHRFLMNDPAMEVDHINRDGLDNRLSNLRLCTSAQNKQNTKLRCNNSTGFKGVYFNKRDKSYYAQIKPEGDKRLFLGTFKTAEEASQEYKRVAKTLFGDFYND